MFVYNLYVIHILLSTIVATTEPAYCKDYSSLSAEIEMLSDKKALLSKIKGCFDYLKDDKEYIILLSKVYILNENYLFARNILLEFYNRHPDCEIAGYIGYISFLINDVDTLKDLLALCAASKQEKEEVVSRFVLLNSLTADVPIKDIKVIYPEDYRLFLAAKKDDSLYFQYLLKLKTSVGYTTNAFSSNPLDISEGYKKDSPLSDNELGVSLSKTISKPYFAEVDADLKGIYFFEGSGNFSPNSLSGLTLSFSPALGYRHDNLEISLRYRFDTLLLNVDTDYEKAPILFFEGHRSELFMNILDKYILLAGAGRRYFDEIERGRRELDSGFGYYFSPLNKLKAYALLAVRFFDAKGDGYDDFGQTVLLNLIYNHNKQLKFSQILSLGFDNYINSTGYFEKAKRREDKAIKYLIDVGYAISQPIVIYFDYILSYRDSLINYFDYVDHRFIVGLKVNLNSSQKGPDVKYIFNFERENYPLNYEESNLQNLINILKEDDSINRGSQCKD